MPALSHLVKPDKERPWLKTPLLQVLTRLPIRPRGVQDAIEFILSAHARQKPLTSNRNGDADGGRGSAISHEALNYLAKLFSLPAKDMSPDEWFATIAPQLFDLLDGRGQPEMDRTAAYIIGFGILGLRQYGLPGSSSYHLTRSDTNCCRYSWMESIRRSNLPMSRPFTRVQTPRTHPAG